MNVEENEMETNAIIKYNGEVTLFRAMITDIACTLSLSLFPFDQVFYCFIHFFIALSCDLCPNGRTRERPLTCGESNEF